MAGVKQPDDKSHFILPDLGEGVHEAELIKWRVEAGDTVKEHQTHEQFQCTNHRYVYTGEFYEYSTW